MFVHGAYCKHGVDEKASIVDNFFCKIPYMNPIGFLLKKQRLIGFAATKRAWFDGVVFHDLLLSSAKAFTVAE